MNRFLIAVLIVYGLSYVALRTFSAEVWAEDGKTYVIFPETPIAIYYAFRPLSYVDGFLTGMGSHVGPHQ